MSSFIKQFDFIIANKDSSFDSFLLIVLGDLILNKMIRFYVLTVYPPPRKKIGFRFGRGPVISLNKPLSTSI